MSDNIIWASVADGSFGGCAPEDLIVIRESDMTPAERDDLDAAQHIGDEVLVIQRIADRIQEAGAR